MMNASETGACRLASNPLQPTGHTTGWAIFLLVAGLSTLLTSGNIRSADYVSAFSVARNLVADQKVAATPVKGFEDWAVTAGADGNPYTRYGLGHSLLGLPGVAIGRLMGLAPGPVDGAFNLPRVRFYPLEQRQEVLDSLGALLVNAMVVGALAAALLALAMAVGMARREATLAALLGSLGSPLFFQASDFTAEPASALAIVLACLALSRPGTGRCLLAGLAVGATVILKVAHGILLVPAALAVAVTVLDVAPGGRIRTLICRLAAFGAGAVPFVAAVALYNVARFGTPFETGYGQFATAFTGRFIEGALGQWFSPGRGVAWYFPAAIAAIFAVPRLARISRPIATMAFGSLAILWLLYSPWFAWDGGWTYGPRLLSPALAVLAIPAVAARPARPGIFRGIWLASLVVSFLTSSLAFAVDYIDYSYFLWKIHGNETVSIMRWSLIDSPLVAWWGFPERRDLLIHGLLRNGGPWTLWALMATALFSVVAGATIMRRAGRIR